MNPDPADPLFRPVSIKQAMAITGRSRRTIDRWIRDGHLRTVRIQDPPEDVLVERDVVRVEKAMRDSLRQSQATAPNAGPEIAT